MNLPLVSPSGSSDEDELRRDLEALIESNHVILFMKGSPERPACGFSARAAGALSECISDFAWVDVLENPMVRQQLSSISKWPTIPQLFVDGEMIGGADITCQLHRDGDLQRIVSS